jgi:hypothetical protein
VRKAERHPPDRIVLREGKSVIRGAAILHDIASHAIAHDVDPERGVDARRDADPLVFVAGPAYPGAV